MRPIRMADRPRESLSLATMKGPNPRLVDAIPPIMPATAVELDRLLGLRATRTPQLQHLLLNDPAAAIAVFRTLGRLRPGACDTVSDAAHAISLIGVDPLREVIQSIPRLTRPQGGRLHEGANFAYSQAAHAAHYANALAEHAGVGQNHEVPTAALLHHPAVIALWTAAPESAQRATYAVRDGVDFEMAFSAELGEPVEDANQRLAEAWSLPALARQSLGDWDDFNPRPQLVKLADSLAQTTSAGWHGETLAMVSVILAEYLDGDEDAAIAWLHRETVEAARRLQGFDYPLPVFELLLIDDDDEIDDGHAGPVPEFGAWRTRPPPEPSPSGKPDLHETVAEVMRRIRRESGATRVMFAMIDRERRYLKCRITLGGAAEDALRRLEVRMDERNLFSLLMTKPQSVWLHRGNARKYQAYLSRDLRAVFGPEGAFMMSIYVGDKPLGLFYADGPGLSDSGYAQFRSLCREAAEVLSGR
jgi:HD-like signal output (HDOD) protein